MPIVLEREAKTVSEATISICEEFGLRRDELDVVILEEGSKGVFGIGSKNAKVRVTVKLENVTEKGLRSKKALEALLGFFSTDYSVSIKETADRIKLDVKTGEDKGILIGKRGEMLRSIEFLLGKMSGKFSKDDEEDKRISIDIGGYKKRREESIVRVVRDAARKVKKSGKPITLDPMSSFERKIAYTILKRENGLRFDTKVIEGDEKRITISSLRDREHRSREAAPKKIDSGQSN